jgi:hypothetical protein
MTVLRSFSWKGVGVLMLFALGLAAWTWCGVLFTDKPLSVGEHIHYLVSLFQRNLLSYFPIYLLVALVDGLPLEGTRRRAALIAALLAGVLLSVQARCAVAPNQMVYVYSSTMIPFCSGLPTWRTYFDFPGTFITPFTIAGMVMIFVFSRRRDAELVEALHATRAEELEARRQRIESEIEAMQSRVDPDGLLATLRRIRGLYETSLEEGEAALERLIGDLRQAARRPADDAAPEAT